MIEELDRLLTLGGRHYVAGRYEASAEAYARAETLAPDDPRAIYSLAMIDIRAGRLGDARVRLQRVIRLDPKLTSAWRNLAAVSQDLGDWTDAAAALRRVGQLEPGDVEAGFALARALVVVGRVGQAAKQYRALARIPACRLRALSRLGLLRPADVDEAEAREMAAAAARADLSAEVRAPLLFALGGVHELRGRDAAAFEAFAEGNRIERERLCAAPPGRRPADLLQAHAAAAAHVRGLFTPEFLRTREGQGEASLSPIFIVGMPRSGSTLIEQILASHPAVQGLGETGLLPRLLERAYPADAAGNFSAPISELARLYLAQAKRQGWDGRRRFVDKTLENWLHLGAVRLMFPRAVILHATREAMDTCFACFRQLFTRDAETLYAQEDIAAEYLTCARTVGHFSGLLGDVIDVPLEDLVAEPKSRIRWLVTEASGLDWDPACETWWRTERPVRTASAAQVRSPMQGSHLGRWRRHADRLGPMRAALQR